MITKIKSIWSRIYYFVQRSYRSNFSFERREKQVWNDFKKLCDDAKWKYGLFEGERYVEILFEIAPNEIEKYLYVFHEGTLSLKVRVARDFDENRTIDVFVLAQHFNNLLSNGLVTVNVNEKHVEYILKTEILVSLLYTGELYNYLRSHHSTSKDIYASYRRLLVDDVEPAIIIADLLQSKSASEG